MNPADRRNYVDIDVIAASMQTQLWSLLAVLGDHRVHVTTNHADLGVLMTDTLI